MSDQKLTTIEQSIENIFNCEEPYQYFFDNEETIWFHGSIICQRLEFSRPDRTITNYTDEDERQIVKILGRDTWFVSEPGLWGLILRSKSNDALRFKRSLKHDILPRLRKNRVVAMPDVTIPQMRDEFVRVSQGNLEAGKEFVKEMYRFLDEFYAIADSNERDLFEKAQNLANERKPALKKLAEKAGFAATAALREMNKEYAINKFLKFVVDKMADATINPEKYDQATKQLIQQNGGNHYPTLISEAKSMVKTPGFEEKAMKILKETFSELV